MKLKFWKKGKTPEGELAEPEQINAVIGWKPEMTVDLLKEFDKWCAFGIKNYPNFPVGRTDKLGKNIVAQFIQYKYGVTEQEALDSEYGFNEDIPCWHDTIRKWWINPASFPIT